MGPETVHLVRALSSDFVAGPTLAPVLSLLSNICGIVDEIPYQKDRCQHLCTRTGDMIMLIQNTELDSEHPKVREAAEAITSVLREFDTDLEAWIEMGFWKCWYYRHEMRDRIDKYRGRVKKAAEVAQLASIAEVQAEVRMLQNIVRGQGEKADAAADRLNELQTVCVEQSVQLLPSHLKCDCELTVYTPAVCGSKYDIYKGLWLGKVPVALKLSRDLLIGVRDERSLKALKRQIDIWRKLKNPHVLRLFGWADLDGEDIYVVCPWLRNGSVKVYLAKEKLSSKQYIALIRDVLSGLAYLHGQGVLHGSLQPSNVLIEEHGRAVLSDFTLAKRLTDSAMTPSSTQASSFRYQAPEISDTGILTKAADMYSWAMTALEIVSGHPPFHKYKAPGQMIKAILANKAYPHRENYECVLFREYPEAWDLLASCWDRDADRRPSAEEALDLLDELVEDEPEAVIRSAVRSAAAHLDDAVSRSPIRLKPRKHDSDFRQPSPSRRAIAISSNVPSKPNGSRVDGQDSSRKEAVPSRAALKEALASLRHCRIPFDSVSIDKTCPLGQGGFGDVYLGKLYDDSSATIAVKVIRPTGDLEQQARVAFRVARELKIWSRFNHPNVLRLVGFCLNDDFTKAWLISPYEPLGNVGKYLQEENPDTERRLELVIDTAEGLAYLHTLDPAVCHGDIKAANVLINKAGKASLCDFGLTKAINDVPSGLTTSETLKGSPRYLSPEVLLEDNARLTIASDIWAWGCLAAEIMTGRIPYDGASTHMAIVARIITDKKPAIVECPQVPSPVGECIRHCWHSDPKLRRPISGHIPTLRAAHKDLLANRGDF